MNRRIALGKHGQEDMFGRDKLVFDQLDLFAFRQVMDNVDDPFQMVIFVPDLSITDVDPG